MIANAGRLRVVPLLLLLAAAAAAFVDKWLIARHVAAAVLMALNLDVVKNRLLLLLLLLAVLSTQFALRLMPATVTARLFIQFTVIVNYL